ncbi:tetratricopeptide repeat protein [Halanaerobaculum tunisiense]
MSLDKVLLLLICLLLLFSIGVSSQSKYQAQWQQIVKDKQKLVEPETTKLQVEYELAVGYANLGQIKEANQLFDKLEESNWEQKIEELISTYKQQVKQEETDIKVLNYLAFAYFIDHKYTKAEELFKQIIQLDTKNIWSYNYLAVSQHKQKKYKAAHQSLQDSLAIEKNDYTHFLLGVNYYQQGNVFKAMYHISKGREAAKLFLD